MYSEDLCWRVVDLKFKHLLAIQSISQILSLSKSTVTRTVRRFLRNGAVNHKPTGRPRRSSLHPYEQLLIIETFSEDPSTTLKTLKRKIQNVTGNSYELSTLSRNIRRLGITRKKVQKVARQRNEISRIEYRAMTSTFNPDMFVFVDETGFDRRLVRTYGYSFKGKRAELTRTAVRGERYSCIAAIGLSGLRCLQTVQGSVNGHDYMFFIQRYLLPVINPFNGINPYSVVIMDNAAIHHVDEVRELIEGAGALLLFLPPYSPDLNPIEAAFSKIKHFIRMNDIVMESVDDPEPLITEAFYNLSSSDCHGYFRHCEYAR